MREMKKMGVLLAASALSFGLFSSVTSANTLNPNEEKVQIRIASTEMTVTKSELVKKFKAFFPNQFDFLSESDFQMNSGSFHYQGDDTVRYDLNFNKMIDGKNIYGSIVFAGENLEVESLYYQPTSVKDALFPAKVSKEDAKKIAVNFVNKFAESGKYQLDNNSYNHYYSRILTEPITYSFSFVRTENQVPIADQIIQVSVLGNGEVVNFYRMPVTKGTFNYDDVKAVKDKNEMLEVVKKNIPLTLQYQVNYDYETGKQDIKLVYKPFTSIVGVHALSGKWQTLSSFTTDVPQQPKIELLSPTKLPPKSNGITVDDAKKLAEQLLQIDSDRIKLNLGSVSERENNGKPVISIDYQYQYRNGSHGASLEFDKQTGEIISFYDIRRDLLQELDGEVSTKSPISKEEAVTQAIKYLKEMVPSNLNNYSKPLTEPNFEEQQGIYYISFPRIMNGLIVDGDQISVEIAADGTLKSLYTNYQQNDEWPAKDSVISMEKAQEIYKEALSLKLQYAKQGNEDKHYNLVYTPVLNDNGYSYIDANSGEIKTYGNGETSSVTVTHPSAEEELNYLIHAKILDVKDAKAFNANAKITKGEALKVLIKSLTYFYSGPIVEGEMNQSFENIDPKHPLYPIVERAVSIGLLDPANMSFNPDESITREELAVWSIRILGLEQAAKQNTIYQLSTTDADKVAPENIGYVAIANALGIVAADQNKFNPDREVTYAEIAVSMIRLAYEISEKNTRLNY